MNNVEFTEIAESLYLSIETILDKMIDDDIAIDYESGSGVITIDCEDTHSKVIISRQSAAYQIWVAAKSGGFHFNYKEAIWRCSTTDESLEALLNRVCTEQSHSEIVFTGVDAQY